MTAQLQISMNDKLFLRDPNESELGRKIITHSISMIKDRGFEDFTFRKLAKSIGSTEAGIYRYFENKHRVLIYLTAWYWGWLEYQVQVQTNNIKDKKLKINKLIDLIMMKSESKAKCKYINEDDLYEIILSESVKIYHGHRVPQDNKDQLFKPYKDLCALIGNIFLEFNPNYQYPKSLASTVIEVAHCQVYFMNNLPLLTDFGETKDDEQIIAFLRNLVFSNLEK